MNLSLTPPYTQRRAKLASLLGAKGIAILPTAPEQQRNRDSDFLYRQDSYFYYLTGFTEPKAWLVITGDGKTTLFCPPCWTAVMPSGTGCELISRGVPVAVAEIEALMRG